MPKQTIKLCFATNNKGKIHEVKALLGNFFDIVGLKDIGCFEDLPETHDTFQGNSEEKAQYVFDKYHVNCFADDSGLEVDALGGAPGVYSARYSGAHGNDAENNALLLQNMKGKTLRSARYRIVLTLILNGAKHQFVSSVEGIITEAPKGTGGFGYDPLFVPNGYTETFAELPLEVKNSISHRGKAVGQLVDFLSKEFPG